MKTLLLLVVLSLSHLFTDHAVLQRETQAPVWGWGTPGATVEVQGSWNGQSVKTTVQADSSWRVTLFTGAAGGPYTLQVRSGKEKRLVRDIWLGEVWICSGQSNMEMPVSGFGYQDVEGSVEAVMSAGATASRVRVFAVKTDKCTAPVKDVDAVWKLSTPNVTAWTSAIGYFFARRLQSLLDVPVGIITNPWGGSRIEPWMTREAIAGAGLSAEELAVIDALRERPENWPQMPQLVWNGRVAPIAGYAARGILWYQGCSNMDQPCYDKLQAAMVRQWREAWGRELPFIYALLAPYEHGDANGRMRPFFTETQLNTENLIPQAWAVCTETLGSLATIHPPRKREVADLMVQRALQNVYGISPGFCIELPRLDSADFRPDGSVAVRLTNVWGNLGSMSAPEITGFELAGEDRVFHLAQARVEGDGQTVLVRCPEAPCPVAVRYAFRNWMGANLQTSMGIPVPPFRSDQWEY